MIFPGEKHPEEITDILQVHPTLINVAGGGIRNSRELKRKVKDYSCFLCTGGYVLSKDLRDHIDWVVEKISPHRESLRAVQKIDGVK
ncbi:DUF4279 domain-containing protein [Pseudomonas alabamensis]|uniref:DUF4279 domain-containing protein n=1 Tax=Pseudomonas alabamensis TaxID=3064349 RepID=UPI003F64AD11